MFSWMVLQVEELYVVSAWFELSFFNGMYDFHYLVVDRSRTADLAAVV